MTMSQNKADIGQQKYDIQTMENTEKFKFFSQHPKTNF